MKVYPENVNKIQKSLDCHPDIKLQILALLMRSACHNETNILLPKTDFKTNFSTFPFQKNSTSMGIF